MEKGGLKQKKPTQGYMNAFSARKKMSGKYLASAWLAAALVLVGATHAVGFPVTAWKASLNQGQQSSFAPYIVPYNMGWELHEAVWQYFPGKAVALAFIGTEYQDVSVVWDANQKASLVGNGTQTPVLMDVARVDSAYFANNKRDNSSIEFCVWPENNGNNTYAPKLYVDLIPSEANTGIWDGYPVNPVYDWNPSTDPNGTDVSFPTAQITQGTMDVTISLWFTIFIFDDDPENGESNYKQYEMEYVYEVGIKGWKVQSMKFNFDDWHNYEGLPEPSTVVLVGVGIVTFGLRRRRKII